MSQFPIFFLTTDPSRAIGLENQYEHYHIICIDYTPLVDMLQKSGVNIFCYEQQKQRQNSIPRNTRVLLTQPEVQDYLFKHSQHKLGILLFKPNFSIAQVLSGSQLSRERDVISLNAEPKVSLRIENKLYFWGLCKSNQIPHPPSTRGVLARLQYSALTYTYTAPFVIQFEQGWFGNRTFFIHSESDLKQLQNQFSNRLVKISQFIPGHTLTNNAVVTHNDVYQSYPFYQLSGASFHKLAQYQGSTVGNKWEKIDNDSVRASIKSITEKIGLMLRYEGFLGFFGLDFIVYNDQVYVQEVNPRLTASVSALTCLEYEACQDSLLAHHCRTFGIPIPLARDKEALCQPCNAIRVIARYNEKPTALVKRVPQNGIYTNNGARFERPDYDLTTIRDNEFLLYTVGENREITQDQELLQIQSKVLTEDEAINLAVQFKEKIGIV